MNSLPAVFRRFVPQLLHMIVLPVFFFIFVLIYRPVDATSLLGSNYYGVHITLLSCIILVSTAIVRLIYFFLPLKLNYTLYIFWCLSEMIFMSFFSALYVWLVLYPDSPYFEVLTSTFTLISLTLVIPYSILALSIRVWEYHERVLNSASDLATNRKMRFYDEKHNLKIVLDSDSILYISAEENYVHIYYVENNKVRNYVLRSSMKAIEELCIDKGLVRCHRSFFVNPLHVKVLRKEQEGIVYAELDAHDVRHIPVTKRHYDRLAELL